MVEVDGFEPPRPLRAQDLQSRAIDRYAIPPNFWWTVPGSNRGLRLAKPLCSQLYQQPKFLATRDGIEPPLEVLETSALPLY